MRLGQAAISGSVVGHRGSPYQQDREAGRNAEVREEEATTLGIERPGHPSRRNRSPPGATDPLRTPAAGGGGRAHARARARAGARALPSLSLSLHESVASYRCANTSVEQALEAGAACGHQGAHEGSQRRALLKALPGNAHAERMAGSTIVFTVRRRLLLGARQQHGRRLTPPPEAAIRTRPARPKGRGERDHEEPLQSALEILPDEGAPDPGALVRYRSDHDVDDPRA